MADQLGWLLSEFSRTTAGVRNALVVSADGLKLATSPDVDPALADQLSAAASGLVSLARGTAMLLQAGPVTQTILEMEGGYLFVTAISHGATLAVHAERSCDIGMVGYEMTMLAARLGVLRSAGLDPAVDVADLDEEALLDTVPDASPAAKVTMLASAKATTVARRVAGTVPEAVVIGCDSMLHIGGELVGKPRTAERAAARWRAMAGKRGELVTGHAVLRTADGGIDRVAEGHAVTGVRFAEPSDEELAAYVATGEPLAVAGSFTLDGLGGWFVEGIDGDPSNVIGISLPLTRKLLAAVGLRVTDLWKSD